MASIMVLSCSKESVIPNGAQSQTRSLAQEEDEAFAELFAEIDALNAKYSKSNGGEIQPYIVMPRWLREVLNIVCADALGGLAGSWGGVAGATIGAIISSVSAGHASIRTANSSHRKRYGPLR